MSQRDQAISDLTDRETRYLEGAGRPLVDAGCKEDARGVW
jgi:hypothetical protein